MSFNGSGPMNKRPRIDVRADSDAFQKTDSNHADENRRKRPENPENCVLLYTIFNPVYPITTDVIYTISSPSGPVLRIVIFKKTGVQAMVEFDSIESARRAKDALNGADIYSGCCTLKIEFAKPTRLNVHKNDAESWDYTLNSGGEKTNRPPPLLQEPRFGAGPQPYRPDGGGGGGGGGTAGGGGGGGRGNFTGNNERFSDFGNGGGVAGGGGGGGGGFVNHMGSGGGGDRFGSDRFKGTEFGGRDGMMTNRGPGFGMPAGQPSTGCVMMVYGLDMRRINCDRLFNLFCLYGNVARIKFLKTKEGSAMIQMGDGLAVERCVQYLNNTPLFGGDSTLQLGFSKQPFLADVPNPYTLPDGTLSYKDFTGNKHNRFSNPAMSIKNRVQAPSRILHFFNTPPNIEEETLLKLFNEKDLVTPSSIKIFPLKSERSSSGLLEFNEIQPAMEALLILNHAPVENPNGKFPYTMKLCFSSSRQTGQNGSTRHDD